MSNLCKNVVLKVSKTCQIMENRHSKTIKAREQKFVKKT